MALAFRSGGCRETEMPPQNVALAALLLEIDDVLSRDCVGGCLGADEFSYDVMAEAKLLHALANYAPSSLDRHLPGILGRLEAASRMQLWGRTWGLTYPHHSYAAHEPQLILIAWVGRALLDATRVASNRKAQELLDETLQTLVYWLDHITAESPHGVIPAATPTELRPLYNCAAVAAGVLLEAERRHQITCPQAATVLARVRPSWIDGCGPIYDDGQPNIDGSHASYVGWALHIWMGDTWLSQLRALHGLMAGPFPVGIYKVADQPAPHAWCRQVNGRYLILVPKPIGPRYAGDLMSLFAPLGFDVETLARAVHPEHPEFELVRMRAAWLAGLLARAAARP
jgi:hypothetical protein